MTLHSAALRVIITKKGRIAFLRLSLITLFYTLSLYSCYHFSGNTTSGDVLSPTNIQKIALIDSTYRQFDSLRNGPAVFSFYSKRHFIPVWWNHSNPSPLADSMLYFISKVRTYGLLPQHYHLEELKNILYDSAFENDQTIRRTDVLFTDAFISIAKDLQFGRLSSENAIDGEQQQDQRDSTAVALLNTVLHKNEIRSHLEARQPSYPQYYELQSALRQMLDTCDAWKRDLLLSGKTIDTLIESSRIVTLEINMDRWRNESLVSQRYIMVNIPGCFLQAAEDDTVRFESKVIVGTEKNQTPVLDGLIRSFIIFPYWNVPRSIAVNEILPQVKKDSLYLANHHYEILNQAGEVLDPTRIDWSQLHRNNFPYTVRQTEGIHNALGLVKFWFSNPYAVFLHDTNARLLFNREKRTLSHGCVRVENALELGRYLLKDNEICSPEDLDQYLEMQKQLPIRITDPIPVHIRYFTCMARNGSVEFYDDVYGEDSKIIAELYSSRTDEPVYAMLSNPTSQ